MKIIQIKSLSLQHFKGIRKLEMKDFQKETNIHGANGTGKTTIFDAFTFLLFGKDSSDRANFEIKTLDANNNVIPKIDHEVEAVIVVDGEEINLKRTFREKWVKKRGALESEFGGNETLYHWNDVPMTLRDYTVKVSALVEESVFKLITSPSAFNLLKWNDQRQVLLDITGGVTDQEIAKGSKRFEELLSKLTNKSMEEYEKQIKSSIRKSKEEIKAIPTRIDEVERSKPVAVDFEDVKRDLEANQNELKAVDSQITDKLQAQQAVIDRRAKKKSEIQKLEFQISDLKHTAKLKAKEQVRSSSTATEDIKRQITQSNEDLTKARKTLERIENEIALNNELIAKLNKSNDAIRTQWNARNAEAFHMDEDSCKCPTCKREFESDDIDTKRNELQGNFQKQKAADLEAISASGRKNAQHIKDAQEDISLLKTREEKGKDFIDSLSDELEELQTALESSEENTDIKTEAEIVEELLQDNPEIEALEKDISKLQEALNNEEVIDIEDLKRHRDQYKTEIEKIKERLSAQEQIKAADKRITALSEEESKLAQQIADYEKDQFAIEEFQKAKMNALEARINDRFKVVKFKLFETQVNGGEVPTCKALIDGVPFSDANTASKINAGIDIINTLCDHYEVSAPIFVDNRESVTKLIPSKSQIINLIVSEADKKLRVEQLQTAELF